VYNLFIQFARGLDRIGDVAAAGALNAVMNFGFNIIFLLYFKLGLSGYFLADCSASCISIICLGIRIRIWRYICFSKCRSELKSEMLAYSKPLVFNNIAWWINNVSDRYIVTLLCGVSVNGIYSVAYKIPSVLNVLQSIFNQAWVLSAVKEFDESREEFYSTIYKIYNCGMVIVCSCLILLDKIIARILFAKDFYAAWIYAPFLMISVVFGAMSGMLGGIFSAAKKTGVLARTTVIGAVINIILNVSLVNIFGAVGAAVSTMVSYVVVWIMRVIEANKIVQLRNNYLRDSIAYLLLLIQGILWFTDIAEITLYLLQFGCLAIICLIYYKERAARDI
jgi:O-antigen/teichoic acid export membrane protein